MSLDRIGPCEITNSFRLSATNSRAGAWLATRLFIHGRPSTLAPCPSVAQLVFVMPTPRYSRVPYALCPALSPPALYNRYSASGVCTAGPYQLRGVGWPSYRGQSLQSGRGLCWRLIGCWPVPFGTRSRLITLNRVHIPAASAYAVSPRLSAACPATGGLPFARGVPPALSGFFPVRQLVVSFRFLSCFPAPLPDKSGGSF